MKWVVLGVVVWGCAAGGAEVEPVAVAVAPVRLAAGERLAVEQVLVLVDASRSVEQAGAFGEAKALTRSFLASLPPDDGSPPGYTATLLAYGGEELVTAPLSRGDRTRLLATAEGLRPLGGATRLHRALDEACGRLVPGREAALVVVTDGAEEEPGKVLAAARERGRRLHARLCIHTVQLGRHPAGARLLRELSELSGCGSARNAAELRDPDSLAAFTRAVLVAPDPAPSTRALPR